MTEFGDVYVVAPDSPQSGMGHAVTFSRILRLHPFEFGRGVVEPCSGTPVDCVKLAVAEVFGEDDLPDLLVSGINHGSNVDQRHLFRHHVRRSGRRHVRHSVHWLLAAG